MKTLYLECNMGAAGDMLTAALSELLDDKEKFVEKMNSLGLPGVRVAAEDAEKCGIKGTHMRVWIDGEEEESLDIHEHDHEHEHEYHDHEHHHHAHHSVADVMALIDGLDVPEKVKTDAKAVYGLIAEAESAVHGKPVEQVHFHEVGAMDAVADVVGVCLLMNEIGADRVAASAVHVGSGNVKCAHGILPVPVPAAAYLLKGVPIYSSDIKGELCTPTGAALLKYFAESFGDMPAMTVQKIGSGMGSKDFARANCVRAFLGESAAVKAAQSAESAAVKAAANAADGIETGTCVKLECNLDDMTGEDLGFAAEQLFKAGARDVYTQPITMKKSRPGIMLSVICTPKEADVLAQLMLRHTTTLGVRRLDLGRYTLRRSVETVQTELGAVRVKYSGEGRLAKHKAEYDDLVKIAEEQGLTLAQVREIVEEALRS